MLENNPEEAVSTIVQSHCWPTNFLKLIDVESQVQYFRLGTNLDEYGLLINQLKVFSELNNMDQRAMLAYMILFSSDESLLFNGNEDLVEIKISNESIFDTFIQTTDSSFELADLSKILSKMALFCTYNTNWEKLASDGRKDIDIAMSNLVMPYTLEEEAWLINQFRLVDNAFRSVPAGKELLHEFLMNSLGTPLSKNYMQSVFRMMMERVRKVWYIHPEFEELPVAVQRSLLRSHISIPHALFVIRAETLSGKEQLQEGLGELDEIFFREHYLHVFDSPEKIAKVSLKNMLIFTSAEWEAFAHLISSTRVLVDNPNLFKLCFLYLLTQPQPGDEGVCVDKRSYNFLAGLHSKYKMILKRRLKWKQDWINFPVGDPDLFLNHIFACLEMVKQVADLNQQVLSSGSM